MWQGTFRLFWCLSQESYTQELRTTPSLSVRYTVRTRPGALNNSERYRGITTSFHVKTEVLFGEHTPEIIDWYLSTEEYKDKAGGYGTQAIGAFLIKEIRGCYYNVMGLPIHRLIEEIMKLTSKEN